MAQFFLNLVRSLDGFQRRHRAPGFVVAVVRKYGDDQAGQYAGLLAYYAFLATFPLLLVLVSVLGIVLRANHDLQNKVLTSGLVEFPVLGDQLRANIHSLSGSGIALAVGLIGTFVGARGLADTAQSAFNSLWEVPFVRRPGFPWSLLRSLGLLGLLGVAVLVTAGVGALSGGLSTLGPVGRAVLLVVALGINTGVFLVAFRVATASEVATRDFVRSAFIAALVWQVLLGLGGLIVSHYLKNASQVYGTFGTVIGLLAWFSLQAQATLYAVEIDVVRSRKLWPRSLSVPPLTPADREALSSYIEAQVRVEQQDVYVTFSSDTADRERSTKA